MSERSTNGSLNLDRSVFLILMAGLSSLANFLSILRCSLFREPNHIMIFSFMSALGNLSLRRSSENKLATRS